MTLRFALFAAVFAACGALLGCAVGNTGSAASADGGASSGIPSGAGGSADGGSTGALNMGGAGSGGDSYGDAEVFGHSNDTLYRLDPITKTVTIIGQFDGCYDVIDIAIDKDGQIFATSYTGLHRVDKTNAACTTIAPGTYPNSLSFVPEGTFGDSETLVGYQTTDYVRIDTQTGTITPINAGAIQAPYQSSGDIVSVINGGTYLTIKGALDCDDCLVEVDPATGTILQNFGEAQVRQIFGLAFWGGSAYGFTNAGQLVEITFGNGSVSTTPITVPGAPPDLNFWGAGSSTNVPIDPPE